MKLIYSVIFSTISSVCLAQQDTVPLKLSAHLETYYSYDLSNPADHQRPGFVYSHNRHNEVALNLGFLKAAYLTESVRANMALMAGTYANANLAAEPGLLKNIFEANAGIKISKTKNIWLDAGIFASHIGFESAIGKDCWNLTRSILADNSPYYESGVKIGFTSTDEKWFVSGLLLNGWQRMQRPDHYNTPAFGHQLTYKPSRKITLNSSTFVGSDVPDSIRKMRFFHNFYGIFQVTKKLGFLAGFDIGIQQKSKAADNYHSWYSPVAIARYSTSKKTTIAGRLEYYSDNKGVIVPGTLQTFGYSINWDYQFNDHALWRIEARGFSDKNQVFVLNGQPDTNNYFLTTALCVTF